MGLQLGAIEAVTDYASKYTGVVVAHVVSCEKLPNADKLSICMVDDGGASAKPRHFSIAVSLRIE